MAYRLRSSSVPCTFCKKTIPPETAYRYVYPIPAPHRSHNFEGAIACLDCWPEVHAAQVEQGLVTDAEAIPAHHLEEAHAQDV